MIAGERRPAASAEDVFLAWLLGLPDGADVADAALTEIGRIDRAGTAGDGVVRLRALLAEAAAMPLRPC